VNSTEEEKALAWVNEHKQEFMCDNQLDTYSLAIEAGNALKLYDRQEFGVLEGSDYDIHPWVFTLAETVKP